MGLCPQHHVFQGGQGVNQHEVLVHHTNALGYRVVRVADRHTTASHIHRPSVGLVKTVQNRHQGAFACTVFAHNAVHRSWGNAQLHIRIGGHRTKAFVDALHVNGPGSVTGAQAICTQILLLLGALAMK